MLSARCLPRFAVSPRSFSMLLRVPQGLADFCLRHHLSNDSEKKSRDVSEGNKVTCFLNEV